jgi:hypothetical protein
LANSGTTTAVKARLLDHARQHDLLTSIEPKASGEHQLPTSRSERRCTRMNEHDRQTRIDTIRQYVATAAAGISIGAALMIVAPTEVMRLVGLENTDHMVAVKTAIFAAAVSIAARGTRITIRWK